ncbi:fatty acid desaturase [Aestuariivita boseongensis]|uniref:fatty acid desaturase n=1 Tax=Aestuariivita boseongensis TaxID=1470562 RepID=UPI000683143A|nr:fatty acid desaturase [Aestuariivita boseongensis]
MTLHAGALSRSQVQAVEWPTFLMIIGCYALWAGVTALVYPLLPVLSVLLAGVLIAFHGSLTHEVLHGHPFRSKAVNEGLMFTSLNLCIPYNRFRDLHLAHHQDQRLTDPFDDPESNYLDPGVWETLPRWKQGLFQLNNTLLGRMVLGPLIGQVLFMQSEWQAARDGDRAVWLAWALHLPGVALVLGWVGLATDMPVWAYLIAAYIGLGLLKIRTFLEHQAHIRARARTVIIEDRGPLAFLFLNNNLHVVHHMHPRVPWYRLPQLYRDNQARYLERNDGYRFRSYAEIFRKHLLRAKDPVPHPLWRRY